MLEQLGPLRRQRRGEAVKLGEACGERRGVDTLLAALALGSCCEVVLAARAGVDDDELAYILMACITIDDDELAYILMACIVMADIVMAYVALAMTSLPRRCIVMANMVMAGDDELASAEYNYGLYSYGSYGWR